MPPPQNFSLPFDFCCGKLAVEFLREWPPLSAGNRQVWAVAFDLVEKHRLPPLIFGVCQVLRYNRYNFLHTAFSDEHVYLHRIGTLAFGRGVLPLWCRTHGYGYSVVGLRCGSHILSLRSLD